MTYDEQMQAWLKKQGVSSVTEAQGGISEASVDFLEPGSEMDDLLTVEIEGDKVRFSDLCGWEDAFDVKAVRALVAKHGRLATWADFERLGDLDSESDAQAEPPQVGSGD